MARERVQGLPMRIRRGTHLRLLRRWWGFLGLAVQRVVARAALEGPGADLAHVAVERPPSIAELPA